MHKALAAIVLACAGILMRAQALSAPHDADYPHGPSAIPLLHEVWNLSSERIYPTELGRRFDAPTLDGLEAALRASDETALADVLNPFLESLGVSHTRFYDRRHQSYYMLRSLFSTRNLDAPQLYTIGVQLDDTDPGAIRAVMEDSPAAAAGIRRHERIVAVDGAPFESLLQWQSPGSVRLTIRSDAGQRQVVLIPILQSLHRAFAQASAASLKIFECGTRSVAYLHLWSGTDDAFLEVLRDAVSSARNAAVDGFILDLRDGFGGAWWAYLDPFFSNRADYFAAVDRRRDGMTEPMHAEPKENPDAWLGPMAVLVNAGTRSGKEALAYQFKKTGRAALIGTTTAGALSGGLGAFADRDDGFILYLAVQETRLDGAVVEGVGVSPDIFVADTPNSDAPLLAALDRFRCHPEDAPPRD